MEAYRADIKSMSGGQIGHIATAFSNHPEGNQYKEIIILTGRNTIESNLPLEKLIKVNKTATTKMENIVKNNPNQNFKLMLTTPTEMVSLGQNNHDRGQF